MQIFIHFSDTDASWISQIAPATVELSAARAPN